MIDLEKEIWAYALKNAMEFVKTDVSKILPKLFQHGLEKNEIKDIIPVIKKIVDEVNSLSAKKREVLFSKYMDVVKVREEKEHTLPELANVKKEMVFRVAPFPSGALHLGNAKTFILNALYAEKYSGKLLLVMDDTIGSAEKPIEEEAYSLIEEAFDWLGIKRDGKIVYKSDRLKTYYEYAEKLIAKEKAYVCHCKQEILRDNRANGIECSCRQYPAKEQLKRWKEMFKMKEGSCVLRIKTDMMHPNPAFRDRVLFKISDREHPRVGNKFRVWPTLEMSWAVDDHLLKISHVIRGNDLMIESDMEKYIWDIFGWDYPELIHTGFLRIEGIKGAKLSKSKSRAEVKSGRFAGWEDPRTLSIQSLARRGILPEAIKEFIKEIGLNKQDISVPIDSLYSINRKIIDSSSPRYSFILNPIELDIKNAPKAIEIELPIHPDKEEKRKVRVDKIYIASNDFKTLKDKDVRLLHLYNIYLSEKSKFKSIENKDIPKINWVSDSVDAGILMPEGEWITGIADADISTLKKDDMIQFERFGFVRYDGFGKVNGREMHQFWFAHR